MDFLSSCFVASLWTLIYPSLSWPALSVSSQTPIPQNFIVSMAHSDYPSTSWILPSSTLQINDIIFHLPSSGFFRRECLLSISFSKSWRGGYEQGCLAAAYQMCEWGELRADHGKQILPKTSLGDMLHTPFAIKMIDISLATSQNLYHDSSFSMIFNVVRNISFEWRWLKHNISGVLFRNSCYSFMLSPNIYLQNQALFSAFQRCGRF